jgi:hypothetical protein
MHAGQWLSDQLCALFGDVNHMGILLNLVTLLCVWLPSAAKPDSK